MRDDFTNKLYVDKDSTENTIEIYDNNDLFDTYSYNQLLGAVAFVDFDDRYYFGKRFNLVTNTFTDNGITLNVVNVYEDDDLIDDEVSFSRCKWCCTYYILVSSNKSKRCCFYYRSRNGNVLIMARQINKEQFSKGLTICSKGKHKLRENQFGIVWCTRCGLLSTSVGSAEKLSDDDKIVVGLS